MDFGVLADGIEKMKERKKINKYLDLAREPKKPWNMKMIPIVIDALETLPKDSERRLEELVLSVSLFNGILTIAGYFVPKPNL